MHKDNNMTDSSQPVEKVDFYKASFPRLAGRSLVLPTLRYLKFRETIVKLRKQAEDDDDPTDRVSTFLNLLDITNVHDDEQSIRILGEVITANPVQPLLEWQKVFKSADDRPPEDIVLETSVGYEGRELAAMVTTLASIFHWTSDYILNVLTYYEACIYMQEALIIEHEVKNWAYMLSQVGYEKQGKEYVKKPLPDMPWLRKVPVRKSKPSHTPDRFQVTGVVIDYTIDPGGQLNDVPPSSDQETSGS